MPFSSTEIIIALIYTWVLGLTPAFIARRVKKAPLTRRRANWIAGITCVVLALVGLILKAVAGELNPRISPAWILVFIVARWIMIRDPHGSGTTRAHSSIAGAINADEIADDKKLSRDQMLARLSEMIADPVTTDAHRQWAKERLDAFARLNRDPSAPKPRLTFTSLIPKVLLSRPTATRFWQILAIIVALDLGLMASGHRLLIRERVIQPDESYIAGDWGDVGTYGRPVLVCWYWTGRKLSPDAFWYGHARSEKDECSVLHQHKPGD